ncbi:MAG: ParB N-terminal domain-containing protein [Planctomycetota bacterium]
MAVKFVEQREVPIEELFPHPDNPNRGSVDDLADSLSEFGQFRSIVGRPDGTILAGHHLVQAAKRVGIKTVRVDIIDVDDTTARKIMLADNRLADLGLGPNLDLLLKNLEELGNDIAGTGFDEDYIRMLEEAVSGPPDLEELIEETDETESKPEDFYKRLTITIDPRLASKWESIRKLYQDDSTAFASLLGEETPDV